MNRAYKVIYNQALNAYQVVSELASGHSKSVVSLQGKGRRNTLNGHLSRVVLVALLLTGIALPMASAEIVNQGDDLIVDTTTGLEINKSGTTITVKTVGLATETSVSTAAATASTATANLATSTAAAISTAEETAATATSALSTATSSAMSAVATTASTATASTAASSAAAITAARTEAATATSVLSTATSTSISGVSTAVASTATSSAAAITAARTEAAMATSALSTSTNAAISSAASTASAATAAVSTAAASTAAVTVAHNIRITAIENINTQLGLSSTQLGMKYFRAKSTLADASATGTDSVAIGPVAVADGTDAVAIGRNAQALGNKTFVAGNDSLAAADATSAVVIGDTNTVQASTSKTIAIGTANTVASSASSAITIGTSNTVTSTASSAIAIGNENSVGGTNNAAVGTNINVVNSAQHSVGIGDAVTIGGGSIGAGTLVNDGQKNIGIGYKVTAQGSSNIVLGDSAEITGGAVNNTIVFGTNASATGSNALAIGAGATAGSSGSIALGLNASANAVNSIVLGNSAGIGMVYDLTYAKGGHIIIGESSGTNTDGQDNIAIGHNAGDNVTGDFNIAIGTDAGNNINTASGSSTVYAGHNVSIGYQANDFATATGVIQGTAVGSLTKAMTDASAYGYLAQALGDGSVAFGYGANAVNDGTIAIGKTAYASDYGNVALGVGSNANASMLNGDSSSPAVGWITGQAAPTSVVSVGSKNSTGDSVFRRIVNVADGAALQDAATIAQLKEVQKETASLIGGSVTTNATGEYSDITIATGGGGTKSYSTVQAALEDIYNGGGTPNTLPDNVVVYNDSSKAKISLNSATGTIIENVADATSESQAVNLRQLKSMVATNKTHFVSVNADSTTAGNYDNNLATGLNSMAIGIESKATQAGGVSVGYSTEVQGNHGIAFGTAYDDTT